MRLDKLLSHAGYGTRKQVKELVKSGQVTVNGKSTKKHGQKIDLENDSVTVLGEPVYYQEYYYVMLNKPADLVSAVTDNVYQTVIEWVDLDYHHVDLFPVGRLDVDTTGLLLLTNNGQLSHRLTSPNHKVDKVYHALIEGRITEEIVTKFEQGIELEDFTTKPAQLRELEYDSGNDESVVELIIQEGKFHQVKRMLASVERPVLALHRVKMGPLELDPDLEIGEYRELTEEEMQLLEPYGLEW